MVADGMSGRRHRSNCELVAQGAGNLGAVLFAGMPVTGTIARTATNVRAGARGPVAGMLHAGFLLLFLVVAAPLAAYIPLAALAAVLAIVAWNMAERHEFAALLSASRGDALVLLTTFGLTVLVDLTAGIAAGVVLGAFLFLHRMAEALDVEGGDTVSLGDVADTQGARERYEPAAPGQPMVYRVRGALFFGATAVLGQILDRIGPPPTGFVLDLAEVPLVDTTAAKSLARFARRLQGAGTPFWIAGARPAVRRELLRAGLRQPLVRYASDAASAAGLEAAASRPR
jgi:SulP family sulfate permease